MNATIYSTDGNKKAYFTEPTPVPDTDNRDWDGTTNGMDDYYGEIITGPGTWIMFCDDENGGAPTYTVGESTTLASLKAVFDYKVGSFYVTDYNPATGPNTPPPPPVPTTNKVHAINLMNIICNKSSEKSDELYVHIQADAGIAVRIPDELGYVSMGQGSQMNFANNGSGAAGSYITAYFDYELLVMLWDQDFKRDPNAATFLGNFEFVPGSYATSESDNFQLTIKNEDGAEYTIMYNTIGCP
ncbi:MAG: hypothetical protein IT258_12725 [Saprospiraceae bacterium]|nr:hypothetical protein [Saprospiraceae bacterium]